MRVVPRPVADRLLAEILGNDAAHAALGDICDTVGGRTSGADSGRAAEAWAEGLLSEWGLPRVWRQTLPVLVWERGPLEARVSGAGGWALTALAHGYGPESVSLEAEVVDLGHGEADDYAAAGSAVQGKLVLCDELVREGRRRLHRSEKLRLADENGAAGLMISSSAEGGLPRTGVCAGGIARIPSLGISLEDGERLRRMLRARTPAISSTAATTEAAGPAPRVRIEMTNRAYSGQADNILAEIPGRDGGDEAAPLVLAGGHLDSWDVAQGATDNGLGSAIVLEMARALAALPAADRPRRSLRFALWAAEETGLRGSKHYVEQQGEAGLRRHAAVLNFDMTGDPYGFWLPGRAAEVELLGALAAQLAPLGMTDAREHKAGLHSDHQHFMLAGVPVLALLGRLGEQGGRYYHSIGDTFEKVSRPALCRAAAVGAHAMWAIAEAEAEPFSHMDPVQTRAMIDAADLMPALEAEGYAGALMRVNA